MWYNIDVIQFILHIILRGRYILLMNNFLKSRKSVRDFKLKDLSDDTLIKIKAICSEVSKEDGQNSVSFNIVKDGKMVYEALDGIAGYSGVMIKSPHYIVINRSDDSAKSMILQSYYTESLITKLHALDIATCWVGLFNATEDTKRKVFDMYANNLDFILAIGYEKPSNPFDLDKYSERKAVEDIVFDGSFANSMDIEMLENLGLDDVFYYARFAPSTSNLQPWRFVIKGSYVYLYIDDNNGKPSYVDAGIMMYYLRSMLLMRNDKNMWELAEDEEIVDGYRLIAKIRL